MPPDFEYPSPEPFFSFWASFLDKLSASGAAPVNPTQEWLNQMQRAFFDSFAEAADQFMRSETFLTAMKHGTEASLAWQHAWKQFLQKSLQAAQMPSRADADHMVILLRGMEDRMLERLDELSERIRRLEKAAARPTAEIHD